MKKTSFIIVAAMLLLLMNLYAQDYGTLWKQVQEAQNKDLPQTAMASLAKIEEKAAKEKAYGQLLKAALLHARLQAEVAPDSLRLAVDRLEQQEQKAVGIPLRAVYDAVLSQVYANNSQLGDDYRERSDAYKAKALADLDALASVKADTYEPFVIKEKNSDLYGHDLLSVVGEELEAWEALSNYYDKTGNRRAACLTALKTVRDVRQADSLLARYGDLEEAGEVAIERYGLMGDTSAKERYEWLQQAISRWGTWKRANALRNALADLTAPRFSIEIPHHVAMPQEEQTVQLTDLRGIQSLTMRVWRTQLHGDTELDPDNKRDLLQIRKGATELKELVCTRAFATHEAYHVFSDSMTLGALSEGIYLIEFSSLPATQTVSKLCYVSGVRMLMQPQPDGTTRYEIVDARTGHPLKDAKMKRNSRRGNQLFAYTPTDDYLPGMDEWGRYIYHEREYNSQHTALFTDRAIYRPGQTVCATAIVWREQRATDNAAVSSKTVTLELRDANYKLVAERQATTDKYGKCSAQFTLPQGLLNGRFTIRANNTSTSFSVEEYKRPTFQVEFDDYKEAYQAGDTVATRGRALSYAGVPVQDAKVHYTVKRRVAYWWMSYSWYWQDAYFGSSLAEEQLYEGEAITDDDGYFPVRMPLTLPDDLGNARMYYHFVADADVTDVGGETHAGQLTLPLGTKPTALTCDLPKQVRSDQLPKVTFNRCNAAGKPIEGTVRYRLDGGRWQQCAANAQQPVLGAQLKSGEHRLEAVCQTDTVDMKFVVFGLDDKRPATPTHDWFYVSHSQFPSDGSPVTLQVGSSDPKLYIFYSIFAGDRLIEGGHVEKDAALVNRKLTYKAEYGNGLLITYAWVKDGECHQHRTLIRRPMPNRNLKLTWETFRDRLTPGQQEEWRLKILKPDGSPADASLMAVLYDKSLDQLRRHQWMFSPQNYLSQPSTDWQWTSWGTLYGSAIKPIQTLHVPNFAYSHFDHSVYPHFFYGRGGAYRRMIRGASAMYAKANVEAYDEAVMAAAPMEKVVVGYGSAAAAEEAKQADVEQPTEQEEVQLRENLQETAFCYPQLESDKQGGVVMKFTLPESLTTWRFMGVANTTDMYYGSIEGEAVAKKDVMVQPNMPRFLRMGDEAQLKARIINTSEKTVSGKARLTLTDPECDYVVHEQEVPFTVEAGKTGNATFLFHPDESYSLLICKIVIKGEGFSDGEQHYLPIMPDREYVTKTVPFTQHQPGVKTIDLTALFPDGTTRQKLTVEYTNNPAWLMVQSLPVVGQPSEHSAIDQAASYYGNLLAKTLLAQSPQVKTVFEQWKREQGEGQTLQSQLEKNQELKDLVLAETPWVRAADRETEQKQLLADFFDENGINNRLSMAFEKLKKLQNADGSFSWYPGMPGSTNITVAVEEMLVRLNVMAGQQQDDIKQLYDRSFKYMGKEMVDLVKRMKEREKKGQKPSFPSFTALRWLYVCALDGRQLPGDVNNANTYLIALLKKDIKNQSIYEKALTTIILSKRGEKKKAAEYVQSLKEYTVFTEEMGRYYDTRRAAYSWYDYKIPTEVAAIEAIQSVTPQDEQTVDEMRRWLLQEKRTQAWNTPINSVNAIWAFLHDNNSLLAAKEETVLAIDGVPVALPKATAAIGYVKTAVTGQQGKTFSATKTSEGTSWGAVYAQFFQKTSEVASSESGITIKREVMGDQPHAALTVGSRIKVRITIQTTRDLDFVQVVDRRAACMEPIQRLSGYRNGAYVSPKDNATHYFFYGLAKGKHVMESEYYIDRAGCYETGTCTVGCAYSPEYRATAPSMKLEIKD